MSSSVFSNVDDWNYSSCDYANKDFGITLLGIIGG